MEPDPAIIDYEEYHRLGRTAELADIFERVRARTIADVVRRSRLTIPPGGALIDVGAGEGRYLPVWMRSFPDARILASEISELASQRSAARYPTVEHVVADAQTLPFPDQSFDAVVSVEVIEHVPDGRAMLTECHRVLKPGGWAVVSTPCGNRGSLEWCRARLSGNLGRGIDDGVHFGRHDDPTHLRRYRSNEFRGIALSMGFSVTSVSFNGHCFLWLGEVTEMRVKGKVNIGRRSPTMERAFNRLCWEIGALDWRLFRRFAFASTMIIVLYRDPSPNPSRDDLRDC
jgi:SAM-dependent methyltransferase